MKFITKSSVKIPKRNKFSHKGQNGYVLAIGGSIDYPGAITLAGISALRSGCDLVRIVAPEKVAWAINSYSPDLITIKAKGDILTINHFDIIKKNSKNSDVILFGNGMGLNKDTKKLCEKICSIKKLKVIDADGIKSISMDYATDSILTPHLKELEIFLQNSKANKKIIDQIKNEKNVEIRGKLINKECKVFLDKNNVILLKGPVDTIISKNKILFVQGGNPGMTKGGTGDVLAGLCAGYLSQSKGTTKIKDFRGALKSKISDMLQSAINASYTNKQIGDILLKKKKGFTYLASDMVDEISRLAK